MSFIEPMKKRRRLKKFKKETKLEVRKAEAEKNKLTEEQELSEER